MDKDKVNDSGEFFEIFWTSWKILALSKKKVQCSILYSVYRILLNIFGTFCFPLHLALALFRSSSDAENMKSLGLFITCMAASLKFLVYSRNIKKISELETMMKSLDACIHYTEELNQFKRIRQNVRGIAYIFLTVYGMVGIAALLGFIFKAERSLLYTAWFPLDWRGNINYYYIAIIYQIIGFLSQILMNYADDCFPAVGLCLLSGHAQMLAIRLSKIGYDGKDFVENEKELLNAIREQKILYKLFDILQKVISIPMFIQFCVTAMNLGVTMISLIFYAEEPLDILYYTFYTIGMPLQIFPTCYYGSDVQFYFGRLHYAAFQSNWIDQTKLFKKNLMLFVERSLKMTTGIAGGMLRIHLDTFFSTCKLAYSFFTVIIRLKK